MNRIALSSCAVLVSSVAFADDPKPIVHVDAPSNVVVVDADANKPLCHAPCDASLAAGPSYVLTAPGMRSSNRFELPSRGHTYDVTLDASKSSSFTTGIVLTAIGGAFIGGALACLGAGLAMGLSNLGGAMISYFSAGALAAGGLGMGIPGVILLTTNLESRATVMWGQAPMFRVSGRF